MTGTDANTGNRAATRALIERKAAPTRATG